MTALGLAHQAIQNRFYGYLTRRVDDDVLFMNWSYETDPPMGIALDPADEPDRYPIQLYHATTTQGGDLAGKRVLEVGCGRGGGAAYLTRTFRPASYTGVDVNAAGIEFCRRRHHVPGLDFVVGNAESLPFPDESFDAVVNIESSHCYPHFDHFLSEVVRVLTPGGVLLYADARPQSHCARWDSDLNASALRMVSQRDISREVVQGMEPNSARWEAVADQLVPRFARRAARRGLPVRGRRFGRMRATGGGATACIT
jgi:ubiquinone/menaquinone biosynthesis C-methylase UbiE